MIILAISVEVYEADPPLPLSLTESRDTNLHVDQQRESYSHFTPKFKEILMHHMYVKQYCMHHKLKREDFKSSFLNLSE